MSCLASRSGEPADAWAIDHLAQRHALRAAIDAGATQAVLLSAICVQKPRLAFQHAKLAFEAELRASGVGWTIVRPTAYFKSLSGQIERVRVGRPFLVFGDGRLTACKPIADADLAAYLADCLDDPARQGRVLPIGGPGAAITPREQAEGRRRRPLRRRRHPLLRPPHAVGPLRRPRRRRAARRARRARGVLTPWPRGSRDPRRCLADGRAVRRQFCRCLVDLRCPESPRPPFGGSRRRTWQRCT
ncbi:NAD(P)H-binding protein [Piscinibacter sakaiensis]|uniref:NAD(P)H-binding protein n=1 Tax=Piscinibacter sakaiensis TaxID=1547922 RepID=UPI0037284EA4